MLLGDMIMLYLLVFLSWLGFYFFILDIKICGEFGKTVLAGTLLQMYAFIAYLPVGIHNPKCRVIYVGIAGKGIVPPSIGENGDDTVSVKRLDSVIHGLMAAENPVDFVQNSETHKLLFTKFKTAAASLKLAFLRPGVRPNHVVQYLSPHKIIAFDLQLTGFRDNMAAVHVDVPGNAAMHQQIRSFPGLEKDIRRKRREVVGKQGEEFLVRPAVLVQKRARIGRFHF